MQPGAKLQAYLGVSILSLTPARSVLDFESFAGRGQMLDGRVLEASQVEYKPFGKPPLQREHWWHQCHKNSSPSVGGRTAARFFANGCEAPAARHRSPAAPARHSLQPAKPAPAPKVCQQCCSRSIADRVFFHHSHALPSILLWQQDCPFNPAVATGLLHPILPWQQDCPFNPAVATGLLHPILLWQQDCFTQSCCGNRIAPSILLW